MCSQTLLLCITVASCLVIDEVLSGEPRKIRTAVRSNSQQKPHDEQPDVKEQPLPICTGPECAINAPPPKRSVEKEKPKEKMYNRSPRQFNMGPDPDLYRYNMGVGTANSRFHPDPSHHGDEWGPRRGAKPWEREWGMEERMANRYDQKPDATNDVAVQRELGSQLLGLLGMLKKEIVALHAESRQGSRQAVPAPPPPPPPPPQAVPPAPAPAPAPLPQPAPAVESFQPLEGARQVVMQQVPSYATVPPPPPVQAVLPPINVIIPPVQPAVPQPVAPAVIRSAPAPQPHPEHQPSQPQPQPQFKIVLSNQVPPPPYRAAQPPQQALPMQLSPIYQSQLPPPVQQQPPPQPQVQYDAAAELNRRVLAAVDFSKNQVSHVALPAPAEAQFIIEKRDTRLPTHQHPTGQEPVTQANAKTSPKKSTKAPTAGGRVVVFKSLDKNNKNNPLKNSAIASEFSRLVNELKNELQSLENSPIFRKQKTPSRNQASEDHTASNSQSSENTHVHASDNTHARATETYHVHHESPPQPEKVEVSYQHVSSAENHIARAPVKQAQTLGVHQHQPEKRTFEILRTIADRVDKLRAYEASRRHSVQRHREPAKRVRRDVQEVATRPVTLTQRPTFSRMSRTSMRPSVPSRRTKPEKNLLRNLMHSMFAQHSLFASPEDDEGSISELLKKHNGTFKLTNPDFQTDESLYPWEEVDFDVLNEVQRIGAQYPQVAEEDFTLGETIVQEVNHLVEQTATTAVPTTCASYPVENQSSASHLSTAEVKKNFHGGMVVHKNIHNAS